MTDTNHDESDVWPRYLENDAVQRALVIARHVATWNEEKLYGIELHAPEPDHMAVAAFAVVHEHQKSCLILVQNGLLGSASALMRPSVEALVRGLWLQWADDAELLRFQKGEDSLNLERAIKLIVQRSGVARYQDLLGMWTQSKRTLHGYVHHGYQSLIRRSGVFEVPPEEVVSLLIFSASLAVHGAIEITELADKRAIPGQETSRREIVNKMQAELVAILDALNLVDRKSSPAVRSAI
ncbi:hypothetical protein KGP84_09830 [Burkholderia multivorans]|uniref:DUF6988 family protein n=1 Tax=Burkholderiaceae TaxID=119060 RepID=UPI0015899069|nr:MULTISPECIES: hypothetical protein [Burkholderia cepacia complex]MCO8318103.1 hypothetical protein [Burkholderia multivorans]MCO8550437.1 hypothetical protein [Burkholderia multivorans]MCO8557845.1 hypothetical protein [Burkholderia multivorans]MCO8621417.1 hypothetical protein [Burkholderia multivorans]